MMKKLFLFTFSLCPSLLLLMIMTVHELSLKQAGVCLNSKEILQTIVGYYSLSFELLDEIMWSERELTLHGFKDLRVTMRGRTIYSAWI